MSVTAIDVQVDDVPAAIKLLNEAYGWEVTFDGPRFGELMAGQTHHAVRYCDGPLG